MTNVQTLVVMCAHVGGGGTLELRAVGMGTYVADPTNTLLPHMCYHTKFPRSTQTIWASVAGWGVGGGNISWTPEPCPLGLGVADP